MRFADEHGFYELNPFPGCNQIVVSNHAFIYPEHRGKGYGKQQHLTRLNKVKELGYDVVMCTVNEENHPEKHILEFFQWYCVNKFKNTETGNTVEIWIKKIT